MTTNNKLLIFYQITPRLQGRARRYANGCPHRAGDILAAAADIFAGRLHEMRGEGQVLNLAKLCLAEAARAERRAWRDNGHRVEADWDAWEGNRRIEGQGVGVRRWQASPLADPRPAEHERVTRRDVLERQIERIAGMPLAELAASCAAMGRMQRKRLVDALRRKLGIVPPRRPSGAAVRPKRQGEGDQLDLFAGQGV